MLSVSRIHASGGMSVGRATSNLAGSLSRKNSMGKLTENWNGWQLGQRLLTSPLNPG